MVFYNHKGKGERKMIYGIVYYTKGGQGYLFQQAFEEQRAMEIAGKMNDLLATGATMYNDKSYGKLDLRNVKYFTVKPSSEMY